MIIRVIFWPASKKLCAVSNSCIENGPGGAVACNQVSLGTLPNGSNAQCMNSMAV